MTPDRQLPPGIESWAQAEQMMRQRRTELTKRLITLKKRRTVLLEEIDEVEAALSEIDRQEPLIAAEARRERQRKGGQR
jgi:hypothetical protein